MDDSTSPWWQAFADAIDKLPSAEQAGRFAGLAIQMQTRGARRPAAAYALRAWRLARKAGDGKDAALIRQALRAVTPKYHIQISTDAVRVAAWQAALSDLLRPGMLALEIGAGSGILAMLAARTGADVVSCESDPVIAALAEETVRHNGFGERIKIVGKPVQRLQVPQDLPRPADLLLLDVFSDTLFGFKPFDIIRAASRLLRPGAVMVPRQVSLVVALADFQRWPRVVPGRVGGFDLSPLRDVAATRISVDGADPGLVLRSAADTIVCADLPGAMPAANGTSERMLVSNGGTVNGVVVWLRLELAPGHVLEARPCVRLPGFYAKANFFAFPEVLQTQPGQQCLIRLAWVGKTISATLIDRPD